MLNEINEPGCPLISEDFLVYQAVKRRYLWSPLLLQKYRNETVLYPGGVRLCSIQYISISIDQTDKKNQESVFQTLSLANLARLIRKLN